MRASSRRGDSRHSTNRDIARYQEQKSRYGKSPACLGGSQWEDDDEQPLLGRTKTKNDVPESDTSTKRGESTKTKEDRRRGGTRLEDLALTAAAMLDGQLRTPPSARRVAGDQKAADSADRATTRGRQTDDHDARPKAAVSRPPSAYRMPMRARGQDGASDRPWISRPIGPILHNGKIMADEPSTATSYATAYPILEPPVVSFSSSISSNDENLPLAKACAAPPARPARFSRSRTFSVLSSLTQSFSRSSHGSARGGGGGGGGAASRNVSSSSNSSTIPGPVDAVGKVRAAAGATARRQPRSSLPRATSGNGGGSNSNIRGKSSDRSDEDLPPVPIAASINPRLVWEAQPFAYWSGRFVALEDRFHAELLEHRNLEVLVAAHNSQSVVINDRRSLPLSSSASPLKKEDKNLPGNGNDTPMSQSPPPKTAAHGLHQSATSGAVLQQEERRYDGTGCGQELLHGIADAGLLLDDDSRCRRIFAHLEALCVTDEARRSLHAFQQAYARREKRETLLPPGGTMEDTSFVSRLLSSGRRSLGGGGGGGGSGSGGGKRLSLI